MNVGDPVAWRWVNGIAEGEIVSIHQERHEIQSKGKQIVRNGTASNPAVVIKHASGVLVLKLASEIQMTNR